MTTGRSEAAMSEANIKQGGEVKLSYLFIGATVLSLGGFVAVAVINANGDALLGLMILTIVLACCARGAQDREAMR